MKVIRIYTTHAIKGMQHALSVTGDKHKLSYSKDMNAIVIDDKVIIPLAQIQELWLDQTEEKKK